QLARERSRAENLRAARELRNHARRLQREQVDLGGFEPFEIGQAHLGDVVARHRREAALGQSALQRHLAAFEAQLVEAARTRLLTLVAATGGLAQPRADSATDALSGRSAAGRRLQFIQLHACTFTRYETLSIIPRTAGVSSSSRVWLIFFRPSPSTVALCD